MTEYKSRPRFYESGYIPPIKLSYEESMQPVIDRIAQGVDEMVINSCLKFGINVDKKRLIQVLNGDRSQYEKGEWDMFLLITSAWNGKQYYFRQDDGSVYSRESGKYLTKEEAYDEFLGQIGAY